MKKVRVESQRRTTKRTDLVGRWVGNTESSEGSKVSRRVEREGVPLEGTGGTHRV